MPLWLFMTIIIGCLVIIGVVFDVLNKRNNRKIIFDSKKPNSIDDGYDTRDKNDHPF